MAKQQRRAAQRLDDNPVMGYVATVTGRELWCAGETAIVASSEKHMRAYLAVHQAFSAPVFRIALVRLDTLLYGLRGGDGYAFDEEAYHRFYRQAQQAGLRFSPEDFFMLPPGGLMRPALHLVRVQHLR